MKEPFIKVEDLSYRYDGENPLASPVLNHLSMEVAEGEFVAILGQNGSGKSTLAKLLNMILIPTSGKIVIGGRDITADELTDDEMLE